MPIKILITDDSKMMRTLVKKALLAEGFEVVGEATNGKEAVALYNELKPDLVTMDLNMPEMDGLTAIRTIRAKHPDAKFLMISSLDQQSLQEEIKHLGNVGIVGKPFEPQQLAKIIHGLLGVD